MPRPLRIPGQDPQTWTDAARAELERLVPTAGGRPLHLPAVIAHHPTFLAPYLDWAKAIALRGVLSPRENALLALRTALRCESEFEWGVHAQTAIHRAGMTPGEVAAVAIGPEAPGWSARESALLRAADELHEHHAIGDATWAALASERDPAARLEVAFVVGHYTMLSMVANSAGVRPESFWPGLGQAPGKKTAG
jgi:alkylhydroperoxidase family enzyme